MSYPKEMKTTLEICCLMQVALERLESLPENNVFRLKNEKTFNEFYELLIENIEPTTNVMTDAQTKSFNVVTDRIRKDVSRINLNRMI